MGELFGGWRFAVRRLVAGWRLMLVAAVGVLVAATLLAMTPIYAAAMTDLGLHFRLQRGLAQTGDTLAWVEVDRLLLGDPVDRARRDAIDQVTEARVGWLGRDEVLVEERSPRLDLSFAGREAEAPPKPVAVTQRAAEPLRQPWGAFLFYLSDFERHVEVVEGRLPGASSAGAEAVLPDGFQRHAKVGDTVRLGGPIFDDCAHIPASDDPATARDEVRCRPTAFASTNATATIVGFVRPRDANDPRWQHFTGGWSVPDEPFLPHREDISPGEPRGAAALAGQQSMSLITTRDQFFGAFAQRMPELAPRHRAGVAVDIDALGVRDVPRAIDDLHAWRDDVNQRLRLTAPARLTVADVLERFRNTQTFSQVPLLLILLQVVGIVLYYVVVVMAMLLDRQAEEIGIFRSRGATTTQLLGLHLVEGLVLAVPAALVGPWIAARIVAEVGRTPAFHAITGGAPLSGHVTPNAVLLGALGAGLALLAILLPALLVARRGIVDVKREESRPSGRGIIQRYYLDVGMVLLAAVLLWQLRQRGSVFDPGSVGGWSSDPLLLLSPLVVTLAVAMIVLRLYPPIVRLVVRALLAFRGTAIAIGLRRAGRSPAAYARLMLLLVMAVSVGTFAASYGPTVGRSLDERVRYETGAEARAPLHDVERSLAQQGVEAVRRLDGVGDAALAYRGLLKTPNGSEVAVLSVDPGRASSMLWFREDFATRPMADALRLLDSDVPPGGGFTLPDGARALEVRLRSKTIARTFMLARFRDAQGDIFESSVQLRENAGAGWERGVARWPETVKPPVTFIGFLASDRQGQNLRADGSLQIDQLAATSPGGDPVILEGFEGVFAWTMYGPPGSEESFKVIENPEAADGTHYAEWKWSSSTSANTRFLAPVDPVVPLSALMNGPAMSVFGVNEGGMGTAVMNGLAVPIVARARIELFPTLNPERGFVVVNEAQLHSIAGALDARDLKKPNELWLRFRDGVPLRAQQATLRGLSSAGSPLLIEGTPLLRAAMLDENSADPTLQVSGSGILTVAFIAVLGLSTLGFAVTLVLGARARATEFAVLRAVGSSRREILRALLLEWGMVLVLGTAIGTILGRQVAHLMLRFLDVTERGERVLPPFIVLTDWRALAAGVAALVLVVGLTLALSWTAAMRQSTAMQLRLTR